MLCSNGVYMNERNSMPLSPLNLGEITPMTIQSSISKAETLMKKIPPNASQTLISWKRKTKLFISFIIDCSCGYYIGQALVCSVLNVPALMMTFAKGI